MFELKELYEQMQKGYEFELEIIENENPKSISELEYLMICVFPSHYFDFENEKLITPSDCFFHPKSAAFQCGRYQAYLGKFLNFRILVQTTDGRGVYSAESKEECKIAESKEELARHNFAVSWTNTLHLNTTYKGK